MNLLLKVCCAFPLLACSLFGQAAGDMIVEYGGEDSSIAQDVNGTPLYSFRDYEVKTYWRISQAVSGEKKFNFYALKCLDPEVIQSQFEFLIDPGGVMCTVLSQSAAESLAPVQADLLTFRNYHPAAHHDQPVYGPFLNGPSPRAIVPPDAPVDAQLLFFNGFTYDFVKYDLTTSQTKISVTLAQQARQFAVRPDSINASEVWVSHGGLINQISIVDMAAGKILATIPTTSLDPNNADPTGLVFTNSGQTVLYTSNFFVPDSAGNVGAMLLIDAVNRKVLSTTPLKFRADALLMAPEGLTAYLIGSGKIVYYDVFSGTADLIATFPLVRSGPVVIHPDGTRLFCDEFSKLGAMDLTTRKVIWETKYNLPNNASPISVKMTQDGSKIYAADSKGNVVVLETRHGNIVSTFSTNSNNVGVFPAPVMN